MINPFSLYLYFIIKMTNNKPRKKRGLKPQFNTSIIA